MLIRSAKKRVWMWFDGSGKIQRPTLKKLCMGCLVLEERCSLGRKARVDQFSRGSPASGGLHPGSVASVCIPSPPRSSKNREERSQA